MLSGDRSLLLNLRASYHLNEKAQKSALWGQLVRRDGCSFEQKKLILLKTGRGTLKAIIG
jgi:hypothetical protein